MFWFIFPVVLFVIFISFFFYRYPQRIITFFGFLIILTGLILYLPWGPGYPQITQEVTTNITDVVGCPRQYNWCHTTLSLSVAQFIMATLLLV